jgi:hypothetical protein
MTMPPGTTELIEAGLRAWASGNLDALEAVLDTEVSLRWFEPGEWDCADREQVMGLLRQRQAEGAQNPARRMDRLDENTFVVSPSSMSDPNRSESFPATLITVAGGKVSLLGCSRNPSSLDVATGDIVAASV